jgi:hypothetical protein
MGNPRFVSERAVQEGPNVDNTRLGNPSCCRRPTGWTIARWMLHDQRLLKGVNGVARILVHISKPGTVTLSWYDKGRPWVPIRAELGP